MIMPKVFIAVFLSVLVMLVVPAYSQNQTQTLQTEWVTYDDPILGISVQYPEGWIIEESPSLLTIKSNKETNVTCIIGAEPSMAETSKEAMQSFMNTIRGYSEINSVNSSLVIDGMPAYKVDYNAGPGPDAMMRSVSFFIADKTNSIVYSFGCIAPEIAFERHSPIFEKMISSFKIQ